MLVYKFRVAGNTMNKFLKCLYINLKLKFYRDFKEQWTIVTGFMPLLLTGQELT